MSNISTDDPTSNKDNYTGFQVGPLTEFTLPLIGVGFDAALLYSQRGFKTGDQSSSLSYLEVPINLKYKISLLSLLGAYATAGPYFSYKIADSKIPDDWKDVKDSQFGLNFGLGAEILSKVQIGANYQMGITDDNKWTDATGKEHTFRNSTWTISATYFF